MAEVPWLNYANEGATRSLPLSDQLQQALDFLPELGVTMEVFSGGQPGQGEGPRVGSERHDHGNAGDVFFYKDGQRLDWANPSDVPIFQEIVQRGKQAGITGFGAGDGYMQPGSMHLGFGSPAVWGAGGKGSNAPDWLRSAYAGTPINPAVGAINSAAPVMRPAVGAKPAGGIMGGLGAGISNLLGLASAQAAPIMRGAQAAGQNAAPAIMRAAMGSLAGRTAIIDPMLAGIFNGPKRVNAGSGGYNSREGRFNAPMVAGPGAKNYGFTTNDHTSTSALKLDASGRPLQYQGRRA